MADALDLNAAIEAGARADAYSMGLDLDNLRASADEDDTDEELATWRSNLVDSARIVIEAALPELRRALAAELHPVLVEHQRDGSHTCLCGAVLKLGTSFFDHVLDVWIQTGGS